MYPSDYHIFNVAVACECGTNAAIIFEHIKFLINHNKAEGLRDAYVDGTWWAYGTVEGFAKLYPYMGKSSKPVRAAIDALIEHGLIRREEHNFCHWDHTSWYCLTKRGVEMCGYTPDGNEPEAQRGTAKPKTKKATKYADEIAEVVGYYNSVMHTKCRPTSKEYIKLITARLDEGYSVDDLKYVIDVKYEEWHGTDMERHVVMGTLFDTKFDRYLNQKMKSEKVREDLSVYAT